jgi:hypothetical protein
MPDHKKTAAPEKSPRNGRHRRTPSLPDGRHYR